MATWTIHEWGALGELIGGAAVIVTLIFVVIQLRQLAAQTHGAARANRAGAIAMQAQQSAHLNSQISSSKELARIFRIGSGNRDDLDEDEQVQLDFLYLQVVNAFEENYFLHSRTDSYLWRRHEPYIASLAHQGGFQQWWRLFRVRRDPEFQAYIDQAIAKANEAASAES